MDLEKVKKKQKTEQDLPAWNQNPKTCAIPHIE